MQNLAECLQRFDDIGTWALLSSSFPRAVRSAEILADLLGIELVEQHDVLRSEADLRLDTSAVLSLIQKQRADVILVVTHFEYARALPNAIGEQLLEGSLFPRDEIQPGRAWHIDCETKTCSLLQSNPT